MKNIFLAYTRPLVSINDHLNATAYLGIVANQWCIHPQVAGQCTMSQIKNSGRLVHGSSNEFPVLKWSLCSPDLNSIEHLLDIGEREI